MNEIKNQCHCNDTINCTCKRAEEKLYVCNRVAICTTTNRKKYCNKHGKAHKKIRVESEDQMCTQWGYCATIRKNVRCTIAHNAVIKD